MWKFALQNVASRPLRTLLSVLGLTVAIAGMVGLFSIAGGIDQLVSTTFDRIPGLLVQQRGAPMPLFSALPSDWQDELAHIPGVAVVNPQILTRINTIDGESIISPPRFLLGVDIPSRLNLKAGIYNEAVVEGRFFTADDIGTQRAIISRQIAKEHDIQVGGTIDVDGIDLEIIGLYHCGSLMLDCNVMLDITMARQVALKSDDVVSCYYLESDGTVEQNQLAETIEEQFRDRNLSSGSGLDWGSLMKVGQALLGQSPATSTGTKTNSKGEPTSPPAMAKERKRPSSVEVRTSDDWAERFDEFSEDLNLFLLLMTGIGLLIAVFSIVNTMLMSVTERMTEFGILRANGWRRSDVVRLISVESALLGISGGLLGAFVGWLAVQGINAWQPQRLHLYAGLGLLSFSVLFSTILGVAGGLYPAWRAATLSPMSAIRRG